MTLATRPHELVVVAARSASPPLAPSKAAPAAVSRRRRITRNVTLSDLARATWLLREPDSGTRASAEELLGQLDIAPRVLTVGSNGAVVESVRIGLGVTLVSRDAVAEYLLGGDLEEWRYGPLPFERAWHLVGAADKPIAGVPERFLDYAVAAGWHRA